MSAQVRPLDDLAQVFDTAWLELHAWGIEANTDEQVQWIKTKLARRIMEHAAEGELDVAHLKEFGLQGVPHLCAHRVGPPRRTSFTGRSMRSHRASPLKGSKRT